MIMKRRIKNMKRNVKKILVVLVLGLVGFSAFGCESHQYTNKQQELLESSKERMWTEWFAPKTKVKDTNIAKYLDMKAEVENLETELEQKDKVDLIGLRELEKLTVEADEFFEKEVLGWEEVEPDIKAKAFPKDAVLS